VLKDSSSQELIANQVEFMSSARQRSKGLLKYAEAPKDFAAIFKLPVNGFFPVVHTIGMKFPIDILFCNSKKRVCFVYPNVQMNRFVVPFRFLLGGLPYLIELSVPRRLPKVGTELSWEEVQ